MKVSPANPVYLRTESKLPPVGQGKVRLTRAEINLISEGKLARKGQGEVLLQGRSFEQYLFYFLSKTHIYDSQCYAARANELLTSYVRGKRVLVVPAYGPTAFLFKKLGAREVVGIDADPVSLAWFKAAAKYFNHRQIGDFILATAGYPNDAESYRLRIPSAGKIGERIAAAIQQAVREKPRRQEIEGVVFFRAVLGAMENEADRPAVRSVLAKDEGFDLIIVPFLLGIENGIENIAAAVRAFEDLGQLAKTGGKVLIAPFSGSESGIQAHFGCAGLSLAELAGLVPDALFRPDYDIGFGGTNVQVLSRV